MPQYKLEYRERAEGALLKSSLITADDPESAKAEARREFTVIQVNLGARHFQVVDEHGAVVASHQSTDDPPRER
jgi:hypothetical protein